MKVLHMSGAGNDFMVMDARGEMCGHWPLEGPAVVVKEYEFCEKFRALPRDFLCIECCIP